MIHIYIYIYNNNNNNNNNNNSNNNNIRNTPPETMVDAGDKITYDYDRDHV